MKHDKTIIRTDYGHIYEFTRTASDVNGNPRYLVSFLSLGLPVYGATPATRKAGLSKYRGKDYGGGFVFQSYSLKNSAHWFESLGLHN